VAAKPFGILELKIHIVSREPAMRKKMQRSKRISGDHEQILIQMKDA